MIPIKPTDVTWTDEQWEAIYEDQKNIIVSAGAGSGKTAVLTERVLRKLCDGVHINELLILTFTKAAAIEMADRIRKKINKIPDLRCELNLIDSAYITTFDSFALSIVKKYHYLINVSDKIDIVDSNIIFLKKKQIMDDIFIDLFQKKDSDFLEVIKNFSLKDDEKIKDYMLNISEKLDLLSSKRNYLNNYLSEYYNIDKVDERVEEFNSLLRRKLDLIKIKIDDISYIDSEFSIKLNESFEGLFSFHNYDDLILKMNLKLPMSPRGSSQELKDLKSEISDIIKEIKSLAVYKNEKEMKEAIYLTKNTVSIIIRILLIFWNLLDDYKRENNCYEFNDIAIMAINILKENVDVRNELRMTFKEIMIDEYQDTNDLQEEFISMISNHNVYMVGDIKQSIYRFRNANPYIFKEKYDNYSNSTIDKKIDLNKNFRSRDEVLKSINVMFNMIMDEEIGGANYFKDHQMIFGNDNYLKEKVSHSNDLEIYSYHYDKEIGFTYDEIEAFIIASDILNKYKKGYQVIDKNSFCLKNVDYNDFSIIVDRATSFDLYKKIFSYCGIPVTLLKDEVMDNSDDVAVIKNLIKFIVLIKNNDFGKEFRYLFTSIYRSFLYRKSDEEIFEFYINNSFKKSSLYLKCSKISKLIDSITIIELLNLIEDDFSYYQNLITIGNINDSLVKWEKLKDTAVHLEKMGYDIEMFSTYLEQLTHNDLSMSYKSNDGSLNSVKIMTIHKSKGLEYPICYFCGLFKKFNINDLKDKFIFDNDYGIVVPYFSEGVGETINKQLLKDKYLREEISEKIRLLYVALTRAREKIIIVNPISDRYRLISRSGTTLPCFIKYGYRSLSDIINSIGYQLKKYNVIVDLKKIHLSHNYNVIKDFNYKDKIKKNTEKINVKGICINNDLVVERQFSKMIRKVISKEEFMNMEFGVKIHELLELVDLKKPDYDLINNSFYEKVVKNFLNNKELSDISKANVYKEFEFIYYENNTKYHGIIDLMLEYDDYIDLIDYKLKNVNDENYIKQLFGYKKYIAARTNKKINIYLYSILENKFYKINC